MQKVAIAMDVRSAGSLPMVPAQLTHLQQARDVDLRLLFLDASTEVLVKRFSETRRRHPLSQQEVSPLGEQSQRDLMEAIELERQLLADLRESSHIITRVSCARASSRVISRT